MNTALSFMVEIISYGQPMNKQKKNAAIDEFLQPIESFRGIVPTAWNENRNNLSH